jgi:hypothetical protein
MKTHSILIISFIFINNIMAQSNQQNQFQTILNKTVDNKKVFGTSFAIKKDTLVWNWIFRSKLTPRIRDKN